jgi:hypothetical protein
LQPVHVVSLAASPFSASRNGALGPCRRPRRIATDDTSRRCLISTCSEIFSERRQSVFHRGFNRKGLIAEDKRTRKLAFEALAAFYASFDG